MKKILIGAVLAVSLLSCISSDAQVSVYEELKSLYGNSRYFKLYGEFEANKSDLKDWQQLYFNALLHSLYNKPEESNKEIDNLFQNFSADLDDSSKHELHKTRLINNINLFDYESSVENTEYILKNFPALIDDAERKDYLNSLQIWKFAKDLKHKKTVIKGDSKIKISRDIAGYVNIPLKVNGIEVKFIFDTGANISTVTRSYAQKLKLKRLQGEIEVGTSTDKKVSANLAYADSVNLGGIACYNVLFLVVDDEILSFAGGFYVIDGIIGHPVIKEMKELRLSNDELFVPAEPVKKELKNFILKGFTPVVNIVYNKDSLEFAFDSGAKKTALYFSFFEKYKEDIEKKYELEEVTLEGAGGEMKYKGYELDEVTLNIGGSKAKIEDVKLIAEPFKDNEKDFYGNLGQDFIKQFGTMILNFESMYIEFVK